MLVSLENLARLLDEERCYWFLEGGCCLGYVRNGGFISHDDDIDVGIYCDSVEATEALIAKLPISRKYTFHDQVTNIVVGDIDIFIFFNYEEKIVEAQSYLKLNKVRLMAYNAETILGGVKRIVFEGVSVNVLINSIDYCRTLYGPGYLTPVSDWSTWHSPCNFIVEEEVLSRSFFVQERKKFALSDSSAEFYLYRIAEILYYNSHYIISVSLFDGWAGFIIFFAIYSRHVHNEMYLNYAVLLIEKLYEFLHINLSTDFSTGISGIAYSFRVLEKINVIEDAGVILEDIDALLVRAALVHSDEDSVFELIDIFLYLLEFKQLDHSIQIRSIWEKLKERLLRRDCISQLDFCCIIKVLSSVRRWVSDNERPMIDDVEFFFQKQLGRGMFIEESGAAFKKKESGHWPVILLGYHFDNASQQWMDAWEFGEGRNMLNVIEDRLDDDVFAPYTSFGGLAEYNFNGLLGLGILLLAKEGKYNSLYSLFTRILFSSKNKFAWSA